MSSGQPDWTEIVTAITAVGALVISAISLVISLRGQKRGLKVTMGTVHLGIVGEGLSEEKMQWEVINIGASPITVHAIFTFVPDGRKLVPIDWEGGQLPAPLEVGRKTTIWQSTANLRKNLQREGFHGTIKLRGAATDATGKVYKSETHKFTVD